MVITTDDKILANKLIKIGLTGYVYLPQGLEKKPFEKGSQLYAGTIRRCTFKLCSKSFNKPNVYVQYFMLAI